MKAAAGAYLKNKLHYNHLYAKRIYRKEVEQAKRENNDRFIERAKNPCKAAWALVNELQEKTHLLCKYFSPDAFNKYFIGIVERTVGELPDSLLDTRNFVKPKNQCSLQNWKRIYPKDDVKIVKIYNHQQALIFMV